MQQMLIGWLIIAGLAAGAVLIKIDVPPQHDRAAEVLERQEAERKAEEARKRKEVEAMRDYLWRGIGEGR